MRCRASHSFADVDKTLVCDREQGHVERTHFDALEHLEWFVPFALVPVPLSDKPKDEMIWTAVKEHEDGVTVRLHADVA